MKIDEGVREINKVLEYIDIPKKFHWVLTYQDDSNLELLLCNKKPMADKEKLTRLGDKISSDKSMSIYEEFACTIDEAIEFDVDIDSGIIESKFEQDKYVIWILRMKFQFEPENTPTPSSD